MAAQERRRGALRQHARTPARRLQPALRLNMTLDLPTFAASQSSFISSLSATSGSSSLAVVMLGERPGFGTAARCRTGEEDVCFNVCYRWKELDRGKNWTAVQFSHCFTMKFQGFLHGADGRKSGVQVQRGGWSSPIHRIEYIPHDRLVGMCI